MREPVVGGFPGVELAENSKYELIPLQELHLQCGKIDATFKPAPFILQAFVEHMAQFFKEQGGKSYVEVGAVSPELGSFTFLMQRTSGIIPPNGATIRVRTRTPKELFITPPMRIMAKGASTPQA
jgi:hypothetical protein